MNGFGFIEYDDPLDARDMVPGRSSLSFLDFLCNANHAYSDA